MVSVGATTPRGGTSTRGKSPPQGGQHTGHAPTTGGHTTPRGARRGAPHRGGHQHTEGGNHPPTDGLPVPLITADLLEDQWLGSQSFSQHVAGSTPGSVTFPSAALGREICLL